MPYCKFLSLCIIAGLKDHIIVLQDPNKSKGDIFLFPSRYMIFAL